MIQLRGSERLLPEKRYTLRLMGDAGSHDLDCDIPAKLEIASMVHLAHSSGGEVTDNPESSTDYVIRGEHKPRRIWRKRHIRQPHQWSLKELIRSRVVSEEPFYFGAQIPIRVARLREERESLRQVSV